MHQMQVDVQQVRRRAGRPGLGILLAPVDYVVIPDFRR
jgi:hypothetical protein